MRLKETNYTRIQYLKYILYAIGVLTLLYMFFSWLWSIADGVLEWQLTIIAAGAVISAISFEFIDEKH